MGLFVVMGDPKLLNFFHGLCCAVVVVRECPKALNAHKFCEIINHIDLVRFKLKKMARVLGKPVHYPCPVT